MSKADDDYIDVSIQIGMYLEMVRKGEMTLEELWYATDPFKKPELGDYLRAKVKEKFPPKEKDDEEMPRL